MDAEIMYKRAMELPKEALAEFFVDAMQSYGKILENVRMGLEMLRTDRTPVRKHEKPKQLDEFQITC